MIFKGLKIEQCYEKVGENYQYVWKGEFQCRTPNGDRLTLMITPELCQKLVDVCADHIIDVATEAAESMKSTVIERLSPKKIEQPGPKKRGRL